MRIPGRIYEKSDISTRADRVTKSDSKSASEKSSSSSSAPATSGDVKVSVSQAARALASENSLDVAKVERLRSAVDKGELNMDFQLIADRIVESGG